MTKRGLLMLLVIAILTLTYDSGVAAQDATEQNDDGVTIHVVQRGENLVGIAELYGLTVEEIARLNGILNPNSLEVGQRLIVRVSETPTVEVPTHTVQPGESLDSIAQVYGLDAQALAELNGVTAENPLFVGQVLTLVAQPSVTAIPPTLTPSPTAAADDEVVENVDDAGILTADSGLVVQTNAVVIDEVDSLADRTIHTVTSGDTLFKIAQAYGVTVAALASANNISDPTVIYAGQQLIIPGIEPATPALDLPPVVGNLTLAPLTFTEGKTGRVQMVTTVPASVSAMFMERLLPAATDEGRTIHTILIGVPVFAEAGVYPLVLTITDDGGAETTVTVNVQVNAGRYGSERITLIADRSGLLNTAVEDNEQQLIQAVMSAFNPERYYEGSMSLPAAATMTSPFGTRRSYNGSAFDRFHSGADFAGVPGTPVLAAAAGRVVLADTLNVRGVATVIDHGWGVYTGYWHQTEQYVQPGDVVTTGQVIGTIGSTGRVTGAHLHWELWVNGVPVDPMQWVREAF